MTDASEKSLNQGGATGLVESTEPKEPVKPSTESGNRGHTKPIQSVQQFQNQKGRWRLYLAFPCKDKKYTNADCATWSQLEGGILMEVLDTDELDSTLYSCTQIDGTTLYYKIARVGGIPALGSGLVCCLLFPRLEIGNAADPYLANQTVKAYTDCYNCNLN